jgi:hypothetical protein
MPQDPIPVSDINLNAAGVKHALGITVATVVKALPGSLLGFTVLVAGTGNGTINDTTTIGGAATANAVCVTPQTVGSVAVNFPCTSGIVVVPGTGQTISVSYF